jgi:ribose transport system substrate-binding protein
MERPLIVARCSTRSESLNPALPQVLKPTISIICMIQPRSQRPHWPRLILALLLPLGAHGQNREILGEYTIGIIGRELHNPIYQAAQLGAEDAARDLSRQYSIDVELLTQTPDTEKGADQPQSMAELFVQNADGFVISPSESEAVRESIQFAQANGQKVVFFENSLPGLTPLAAVTADEAEAGRLAGEAILEVLPDRGRVAILTSAAADARLEQRLAALRATLGYKRIHKIVSCKPNYQSAMRAIKEAQKADHDHLISAWVFLADWPLRGMPALPWEPGEIPAVAIQSSPSAFLYLDAGYIDTLIVHPYYEWGYQSVAHLIRHLHGKTATEAGRGISPPRPVNWENLAQYREDWKLWLQ